VSSSDLSLFDEQVKYNGDAVRRIAGNAIIADTVRKLMRGKGITNVANASSSDIDFVVGTTLQVCNLGRLSANKKAGIILSMVLSTGESYRVMSGYAVPRNEGGTKCSNPCPNMSYIEVDGKPISMDLKIVKVVEV